MVSGIGERACIFFICTVGSGEALEKMLLCAVSFFGPVASIVESGGINREVDGGSGDWAVGGRTKPAAAADGIGRSANGRAGKRIRTVSDADAALGFGGMAIRTVFSLGSFVSDIRRAD
jgi:hypothetical protein